MIQRFIVAAAALTAAAMSAAFAADATPSAIAADPSSFEGKTVTVTGKVENFQTTHTLMGTVAGFQLCGEKCIVVIDEKNGSHANGEQATVTGTFYASFKTRKRTFKNAVVIK